MSTKILCILPTLTDTRIARRIDMLNRGGFAVEAVAFARHQLSGRRPDCPIQRLGRIPPRRYAARMGKLLAATPKVRRAIRRNHIVYAFGSDLAFLATISKAGLNRPLVLEVADIKDVQVADGWSGRAVRALEKRAVDRCSLLVLATGGYLSYYRRWLGTDPPSIIIENKLDQEFVKSMPGIDPPGPAVDPPPDRHLRIGWFGRLRDEWTMGVLEALTRLNPHKFTAVLAGTPSPFLEDFSARVGNNPNVEYRGGYSYPADLPALYDSVDLVMACYPPEIPHGWSQSNRYYEACLFRKPLIVRAGCSDADGVRRHDIGMVIDAAAIEEAAAAISEVSPEDWMRWRDNAAALPPHVYLSTSEANVLAKALNELDRGRRNGTAHSRPPRSFA